MQKLYVIVCIYAKLCGIIWHHYIRSKNILYKPAKKICNWNFLGTKNLSEISPAPRKWFFQKNSNKKLSYASTYNRPKLMFLIDAQCLTGSFKHIDVTIFSIYHFRMQFIAKNSPFCAKNWKELCHFFFHRTPKFLESHFVELRGTSFHEVMKIPGTSHRRFAPS